MAKVGLEFGDRIQIADKRYNSLSDGLDEQAVLGKLTWRRFEESIFYTEDDMTQPRDRDGRYPQMVTDRIKWNDVAIYSENQEETIFISIVDMPRESIEELGLKLGDEVELNDVVITWSSVSGGTFKVFAGGIKRKGQAPVNNQPKHDKPKQDEHK